VEGNRAALATGLLPFTSCLYLDRAGIVLGLVLVSWVSWPL
jgi:hypothetical protein